MIKKFRKLKRITQKALEYRTRLDDVLENIPATLHVSKEYLKEPDYPYTEHDLTQFLFIIEVNTLLVILNDEYPE